MSHKTTAKVEGAERSARFLAMNHYLAHWPVTQEFNHVLDQLSAGSVDVDVRPEFTHMPLECIAQNIRELSKTVAESILFHVDVAN